MKVYIIVKIASVTEILQIQVLLQVLISTQKEDEYQLWILMVPF